MTAKYQLLDEQTSHDGLAGTRIVRQQEAQWLPRQHRLVHRRDLVRQRIDERGVYREHRIEQVGESNAIRFRREAIIAAAPVEAPRTSFGHDAEARLVVPIQDLLSELSLGSAVTEGERIGTMPFCTHHGYRRIRNYAVDARIRGEML